MTSVEFGLKFVSQRKTLKRQGVTSPREVVLPRRFCDLVEPWTAAGVPVSDGRAWFLAAVCPQAASPAPAAGSAPPRWHVLGSVIVPLASRTPGKFGASRRVLARTVSQPLSCMARSGCRLSKKN